MKTIGLFIGFALSSCLLFGQEINFSETQHDFGVLRETAGAVHHDFYFMNTGEASLLVKEVLASCGCMATEWTKEAIDPGGKGHIRVTYRPEHRRETKLMGVVEVYTNAGVTNLKVFAEVRREERPAQGERVLVAGRKSAHKRTERDGYEVILGRMQQELLQDVKVERQDSLVERLVGTLRRDGQWEDIDYACRFRTNWEPLEHLNRVYDCAVAYVHPESRFCGNDTLFAAIGDALTYWMQRKPRSHNWWFNDIALPQQLGDLLVVLQRGEKVLPDALQQGLFRLMALPQPEKQTGANKLDVALHYLQRACLTKDSSLMRRTVAQVLIPLQQTTAEGLQADGAYHQHGNQMYIGGYGAVFIGCITRIAGWLHGTEYALREDQLAVFNRFVRETYLNTYRGRYIDYSVLGRGLSRRGAGYAGDMAAVLKSMQTIDSQHAQEYAAMMWRFRGYSDSCRDARSRVFWRSDYALHNRQAYDFSVRTSSSRTNRTEGGNGENLLGALLSDGATSLRRQGDEYAGIFPLWDWNSIPGVTAPELTDLTPAGWGRRGRTVFSGGVSDGRYSAMMYGMNEYETQARKAWLMFDREIVCLGAGISSTAPGEVRTTVEQCRCKDVPERGEDWLLHNRVLYYFPHTAFDFVSERKEGAWSDINYNESTAKISEQVLRIWIDHGRMPRDEKYAYILVPDVAKRADYDAAQVEIWRNDTAVQAAWQREADVLLLLFYAPAQVKQQAVEISVDGACAVLVKGLRTDKPEIYVSDPTQRQQTVHLMFRQGDRQLDRRITLPQGERKGSTIRIYYDTQE